MPSAHEKFKCEREIGKRLDAEPLKQKQTKNPQNPNFVDLGERKNTDIPAKGKPLI